MDDAEHCLTLLEDEMKSRVQRLILTLREFTRTQCETNGSAIQKNISRICQDQARLNEVRCGIESLMQENDAFRFVEPKKKKDKTQMKQMVSATDTAYGTLNVKVSGYDMTVVEHYSQYIHNLCNRLGIQVAER
ncbi:hypothetical protein GOODEAATRI_005810 [Goodea atripinnis]|uniref:Small ribosomal subunit protein uS10 domain-containing protein n=1 Tax=Goodea atripinnis TaxID=208336 RepID=A0ABV0PVK3_9TELE